MTATLPHSACAISCAVSGCSLDQPADLARAPLVHPEALVDQRRVVVERVAVAGEDELDRLSRVSRSEAM